MSLPGQMAPRPRPDRNPVGLSVSDSAVTLTDVQGEQHRLHFDEKSFVRGHMGDQMPLSVIPERYHIGDNVIVMAEDDRVINMRPQH